MNSIRDLVGRELKWVQPHAMQSEYELRDGDAVLATLRFESAFGSRATFESAEGCLTFERVGFWQTSASIRECGSDQELALFRNARMRYGGVLEFPDGRKFPSDANFWGTEYWFKTEGGEPLVTYRDIAGVLHFSALVEIHAAAADTPELPWLVGLGWYLVVMLYRDSSEATVATSAIT